MDENILSKFSILQDDITRLDVDAIVNAANSTLLGGGGVDGAIHRAAGPELLAECREIGGCPPGEARITRGYHLPARHVIHTVGPVYSGSAADGRVLRNCYRNCLEIALRHHLASVAFPAISCGVYGYPVDLAAAIALKASYDFIINNSGIEEIYFVLFSKPVYDEYLRQFQRHLSA